MGSKSQSDLCLHPQWTLAGRDPRRSGKGREAAGEAAQRARRLEGVVAKEILPRLKAIHAPVEPTALTKDDIETFGSLLVAPDAAAGKAFLARMVDLGRPFDALVERLLAPTARRLGELWTEDRCDFLDVTFGVSRLQTLLHMLSADVEPDMRKAGQRVLLVATPDDGHSFGLDVVAAFLRAAHWSVEMQKGLTAEQNARAVAGEWTHVVGITMGGLSALKNVARAVDLVRRASLNPGIAVIVGGAPFNQRPELLAHVGADAIAGDGPTAVILAKQLLLRQAVAGAREDAAEKAPTHRAIQRSNAANVARAARSASAAASESSRN